MVMARLVEQVRRLRSVLRRRAIEDGLAEEIRFHLDHQTEKYIRAGMTPDEARRQAHIRFGGVERMKESTRDEFRASLLEDLLRDLRYGVRMLRRAPGFAAVAVLTLALGIGASTAVFSVVNGVLLRPLPYPDADRIVRVFQIDANGRRMGAASEPNYLDWKQRTRVFRAMAQTSAGPAPVAIGTETTMISGSSVSAEFFDVMGVRPVVGRAFQPDEHRLGAAPAAVISDRLWRMRLDRAPLETLRLRVSDTVYQVIGVMPASFDYPTGSDYWFPRELTPPQTSRTAHNWTVVARLADGTTLNGAVAELSAVARSLKGQYGDGTWMSDATAVPLRDVLTATARPTLLILLAAAVLLLVIATLNVSNLQLARAASRRRELAMRLAIGAWRGRIVRQLVAEALVLAAAAIVAGLAIALAGVRVLVSLQPTSIPRLGSVALDSTALGFAVGVTLATAVVLGLATAIRAAKPDVRDVLSDGTRTMAGTRGSERLRQGLVVAQVAVTIVLLAGAGLLARSFANVLAIDPGFRRTGALLLDTEWPFSRDPAIQQRRRTIQHELVDRVAGLPGVSGAGLISSYPVGEGFFPNGQFIEMTRIDEVQSLEAFRALGPEVKARQGMAAFRVASEGYFQAMGIRLVRGRLFEESDGPDSPHVAVISESLAATKWPDQDPLGRFIQFGNMDGDLRGFRIVGVVTDVREVSPEAVPGPIFYGSTRQRMASRFTMVVRTDRAADLAPTVRRLAREADPALPIQLRTVEQAFDRALAGRRFSLTLIGVFSVVALLLATLGIYGLIAYLVAERTREIGIRLALGADPRAVLRQVVSQGAMLAAIGIAVGLVAAFGATRFLRGMLFGVTETDPAAFAGVVALTFVAVLGASYLPARRAMRVEPVTAMRD
jgi:predicted permease